MNGAEICRPRQIPTGYSQSKVRVVNRFSPSRESRKRRSIRLPGYDIAQAGAYFATIIARERVCLFGEVVDGNVHLNETGQLVSDAWKWLETQYPYVELDEFVIMPNHLHGIIVFSDGTRRGG